MAHTPGLKVFISADMEGVAGIVTADQLLTPGFEYARFREFMTAEVLAAIAGAREAGATEFVVGDSHANALNILIDRLPADVTLIRGFPRPLSMMEGIDDTFDAVFFTGYHTATTHLRGVRAHTISSSRFTAVEINGEAMPESGLNAAIAGYFGVPVVLVTGDDVTAEETSALLPGIEAVTVKRAIGHHSAASMTPEAAQAAIRAGAARAIGRRGEIEPYRVVGPVRLDLHFKSYRQPEILAMLPTIERPTSHSIRYTAPTILDIMRFITFVITYSPDLEP
jgi:D-amino peptidase